jgi:hypothetical protein
MVRIRLAAASGIRYFTDGELTMSMMFTTTALLGGMLAGGLAGSCPALDEGYPLAIDRKALHEIMIHDAHGGDGAGRSILGVALDAPIGLRWARDGLPLPPGDPEGTWALDLSGVRTAWILGSGEDATLVDLVTQGAAEPDRPGVCLEVMTLPLDPDILRRAEELGGAGTPGPRITVFNNVIVSSAAQSAMTPQQMAAMEARATEVTYQPVPVPAPWLRTNRETREATGLHVSWVDVRGDARDFFPDR